ncbi:MAG TPA: VOC family protein [Gemmatimonadales bacterium]|jgi:catechol 2,3-dioxygenase-like lactoylglutathione lyase family enzyme
MTASTHPEVDCEQQHPALAVRDVPAAVEFYTTRLGFRLGFTWGDPPTMAGVNLGRVQMFLEQGTPGAGGCSLYFVVGNADELYEFQRAKGVEVVEAPGDRHYGLRDYRVRDLDGYVLGFGHHLYNVGPRLEIERVEVPVRIEKRLAALLHDLAEYKRMSLGSCLEETLLHTLDGVGPHTASDLRRIARLKETHGIDYDSHASYRFVERSEPDG